MISRNKNRRAIWERIGSEARVITALSTPAGRVVYERRTPAIIAPRLVETIETSGNGPNLSRHHRQPD